MGKPKEGGASKKRVTRNIGSDRGSDRNESGALRRLRHGIFLQEPVIPGVEKVREFRRCQSKVLKSLADLAPETKVRGSEALAVLRFMADLAGVKFEDVMTLATAEAEDLASRLRHRVLKEWTRAEILEVISAIAHREAPEALGQAEAAILEAISAIAHREGNAPDLRQAAAEILASHRENDGAEDLR